ncbi:MAG: hypothetical protein IIX65_09865, partial [Lachnospiraceae bacterium]|nr:hypothetical protein [Lachnospiraceae bacterium]
MKKTFKPMRLFCILMSLLLTLSLSACGNSQPAISQDDASAGTAAPEESTAAPAEPADSAVVLYEETFDAYGELTLRDGPN